VRLPFSKGIAHDHTEVLIATAAVPEVGDTKAAADTQQTGKCQLLSTKEWLYVTTV